MQQQSFLENEKPWSIWPESIKVLFPLVLGSMMCGEFRLITVYTRSYFSNSVLTTK